MVRLQTKASSKKVNIFILLLMKICSSPSRTLSLFTIKGVPCILYGYIVLYYTKLMMPGVLSELLVSGFVSCVVLPLASLRMSSRHFLLRI